MSVLALSAWLLLAPEALPDVRARIDLSPTADPDEPRFSYGTQGTRMRSTFGGRIGLVGGRPREHAVVLSLEPLLELANFTPEPISWQSFRATVGVNVSWQPPLRPGHRLVLHTGFFHESDHVADQRSWERAFLREPQFIGDDPHARFDNGSFSTFEYVKLRADYTRRWPLRHRRALEGLLVPGVRLFTPNINDADSRDDVIALQAEARGRIVLDPTWAIWLAAYGEFGVRRFDQSSLYRDASEGPTVTRRVLLGATARPKSQAAFVLQAGYENSNGRGVDFMRRWGHTFSIEVAVYR